MVLLTLHYPLLLAAIFSLILLLMQAAPGFTFSELTPPESPHEDYSRPCPLPKCKKCATAKQIQAPGVGFALEMGYGTVSIRLHDGSYHNIARIGGTRAYTSLLRRLASGPQNRIPDEIPSEWEKLRDTKKRAQRLLNKFLGRPATPEAVILADLISVLKIKTETILGDGRKVTAAVLSSPDRIRLTAEEIGDVFDYLRIKNLMAEPDTLEDLYATSSAYAGFEMGLCKKYTDPYACEREEWDFSGQRLLHLDFGPDNLSGTIVTLQSARGGFMDDAFIDPTLGLGKLDELNQKLDLDPEEEKAYWVAAIKRIRTLVQSFKRVYLPYMTQIILTAPSALDPRFKAAVRDALRDLVPLNTLKMLEEHGMGGEEGKGSSPDLVFATGRGAAEFAKRRQEGPVRCRETEKCKRCLRGVRAGRDRRNCGAMSEVQAVSNCHP